MLSHHTIILKQVNCHKAKITSVYTFLSWSLIFYRIAAKKFVKQIQHFRFVSLIDIKPFFDPVVTRIHIRVSRLKFECLVRIVTRIVKMLLIVVQQEQYTYINRQSNRYNASRDINIRYLNTHRRCNHAGACKILYTWARKHVKRGEIPREHRTLKKVSSVW